MQCNESKPICTNCSRLDLTCVYDRQPDNASMACRPKEPAVRKLNDDTGDPPESEQRRRLELQLMVHFVDETAPSLPVDAFSMKTWVRPVPRLALGSDALLYAMYCVSAVHWAYQEPARRDHHVEICHTYLQMAVREHARELAQIGSHNVDTLVLTASLIRLYHSRTLQERSLEPYVPPTEWLRATGSGAALFRQAWLLTADKPDSIARLMMGNVPGVMVEPVAGNPENRRGLLHLLRREEPHELLEAWSPAVQEAYESTLSFVGGIWLAMNRGEAPAGISKRLIVFPMVVDRRFIGLVEERRPRALAVLAHYFALLSMLRGFWWIGETGSREVRAIAGVMPEEWRGMVRWPLEILEQEIVFTGEQLSISCG